MLVYGPVPSRRLGRSLGLNNIPYKYCSYACRYCQVGRTTKSLIQPGMFYSPTALLRETKNRIEKVEASAIDYLSFVPDGEPTLDANLGRLISMLKSELSYPVAVITNASLLWRPQVAEAVGRADWVSVKLDSVVQAVWRRINQPDRRLEHARILEGIRSFRAGYGGTFVSETMLIDCENTDERGLNALAEFLRELRPETAYLSLPTRPTAKADARIPDESQIQRARRILGRAGLQVRVLAEWEGDQFTVTSDTARDILGIAAVHPLREDALVRILDRNNAGWTVVEKLIAEGRLQRSTHNRQTFYSAH